MEGATDTSSRIALESSFVQNTRRAIVYVRSRTQSGPIFSIDCVRSVKEVVLTAYESNDSNDSNGSTNSNDSNDSNNSSNSNDSDDFCPDRDISLFMNSLRHI